MNNNNSNTSPLFFVILLWSCNSHEQSFIRIRVCVDARRGSLLLFTQALNHAFLLKYSYLSPKTASRNQHSLTCLEHTCWYWMLIFKIHTLKWYQQCATWCPFGQEAQQDRLTMPMGLTHWALAGNLKFSWEKEGRSLKWEKAAMAPEPTERLQSPKTCSGL